MAKRLTEEMVIARSKLSDLSKVKRLNCWGSELVDVSLLRKMPSVEVLSLSINKINSLCDFQYCGALQELYIRQNDIRELNQICYLQGLPNLKNLWLGENPCATGEGYRMAVLRTLPQLQKLDNVSVTQDELREAARKGRGLSHPEDPQDSEEEYIPQGQYQRYQEYPAENEYSPQQSPSTHEPSPPRRMEAIRVNYSPDQEYSDRRSNNYEPEYQPRQTAQYCEDYTNGDKYHSQNNYRQNEGSEISNQSHDTANRRERFNCPASHQPPFNRRPVTRNSNILSAVLCLVKELDYPSLEVVEMAVRCRMDELEE